MNTNTNLKIRWIISLVLVGVFSGNVWATGSYDSGDGSPGNPFQINTPAQMDEVGQHPEDWNDCFVLTADINLAGFSGTQFNIIGNSTTDFNGVFDGNDHTISNFSYTTTGTDYIGLFGYVGSSGQIKNLGLLDADVDAGAGDYVGALMGRNNGTVSNCYATGSVTGTDYSVGGLVGWNDGTISNCYAKGTVTGDYYVGGLVGWNDYGTISNCYAASTVTGTDDYVGGLVGENWGTVSNCYATGDVTGDDSVGGLVGDNWKTVSNCYATGSVAGDFSIGGLVGQNDFFGIVSNCYAAGGVSGSSNVGGLVGYDSSGSYTSCFWDSTVNSGLTGVGNISDPPDVMARTTAQMKTETTFIDHGWDFFWETDNGSNDIWIMYSGGLYYPQFTWKFTNRDATIIYVDPNATGANDGSTWSDAYKHLSDALAVAIVYGDEVRVAQGLYTPDKRTIVPTGNGDRYATFRLTSGVALYSGYAGVNEPDPNARDIELYETILSGDLDSNDVGDFQDPSRSDNSYHVVTGSYTDANAILDGFTVTAGNANGSGPDTGGGGMYNESGDPTVANCIFSGNYAQVGGGIVNYSASPTLTNCRISDNWAAFGGGGIRNHNSSPNLVSCTLTGNSTLGFGGGMENTSSSSPTLINCTLSGNSAVSSGGGIRNYESSLTLINCVLSGNSTNEVGGGMCNYSGCTVNMTNCTFAGNSASFGRALACESYLNPSTVQISNCILWGNTASDGNQIALYDESSIDVNYCDVEGGYAGVYVEGTSTLIWGGDNIDADPMFVDANGPDGEIGTEDDNLRLSWQSPCIDAGDNNSVPADTTDLDNDGNTVEPIPFDLDGHPRFVDGDCNDSNIVDMGAYEFAWAYIGDFDDECDVDFGDFAILALAWLTEQGQGGYNPDCDISLPADQYIDWRDLDILTDNWLAGK